MTRQRKRRIKKKIFALTNISGIYSRSFKTDKRNRENFIQLELKIIILKLILKTNLINNEIKFPCLYYLRKKKIFNKNSLVKNFCNLTSRGRGVVEQFGMSRMKFKELATLGLLYNISKK